jgi:hypothetical protein
LQADGLVEKSRDMGITWLCCAYALHGWLFRPGFAAGFGSRKLELVDRRGDLDSIFEKLRFLLDNLPAWMLPKGFDRAEHDNLARLVNPANGSTITGEGGDSIGRGGRKTVYFVDEAAHLEHPDLIERSLSQTTNVRIDVSTPNGMGNPFAVKRNAGVVPVFTFSWRDDPRKGEDWYAYQKNVKYAHDPAGLAQEVDIDYTASVSGVCIPGSWVRAAVNLQLPASGPVVAGFDVGEEGDNRSVLIHRQGPVIRVPVWWGHSNTTQSAWRATEELVKAGAAEVHYDADAVGAGVKGTWDTAEGPLGFVTYPVHGAGATTDTVWPDGQSSKAKFLNCRAELWWKVRVRFEKAYEFREKGISHRPEDMISIPNHPQLIAELSLPLYSHTETGKVQVESKKKMRTRGIKSPDFADALVYSFHEPPRGYLPPGAVDAAFDPNIKLLYPNGAPTGPKEAAA